MVRAYRNELRIPCYKCKQLDGRSALIRESIEPIRIKKLGDNRYYIYAVCKICNKVKSKYMNQNQMNILPDEIKSAPNGTVFNNTIERNGGIIPIIPIIAAIAAGISALASAGGATATAVLAAKKNSEDERHHRELEAAARGNGIEVNSAATETSTLTDDELIDRSIKFLNGKGFQVTI